MNHRKPKPGRITAAVNIPLPPPMDRKAALTMARHMYGEMGTISSDEALPRLVWCISQFDRTVGRGMTWERAIINARPARPEKTREQAPEEAA